MFQDESAKIIFGIIAAVVIIGVVVFFASRSRTIGQEISDQASTTITDVFSNIDTNP